MKFNPDRHRPPVRPPQGMGLRLAWGVFRDGVRAWAECVFGEVRGGKVRLNPVGEIIQAVWNDLPRHYPHVEFDSFIVMPNHVHGILVIRRGSSVGARHASPLRKMPCGLKRGSVGAIVGSFKSSASRRINALRKTPVLPLWQRNYYEHIVRGGVELARAREYVLHNPLKWAEDENHPENLSDG